MATTQDNFTQPDSLTSLGRSLRKRREDQHLTLQALANLTGISKPYLANIETAHTPGPPTPSKLRLLEKALAIPEGHLLLAADWLRTPPSVRSLLGHSLPRRSDTTINLDALLGTRKKKSAARQASALHPHPADSDTLPLRVAPLINRVAAGTPAEFSDLDYPAGIADAYIPVPDQPTQNASPEESAAWKSAFACRVTGDSMLPLYHPGDLVVVAPLEARDGEDALVRLGESDAFATTLKRVYFLPDHSGQATTLRLVPRNPSFPERSLPLSQITGIYPVIYKVSLVRK